MRNTFYFISSIQTIQNLRPITSPRVSFLPKTRSLLVQKKESIWSYFSPTSFSTYWIVYFCIINHYILFRYVIPLKGATEECSFPYIDAEFPFYKCPANNILFAKIVVWWMAMHHKNTITSQYILNTNGCFE